jgi:outer membrane protein assembly factor BamB
MKMVPLIIFNVTTAKSLIIKVLTLLTLLMTARCGRANDWPTWQGPDKNGISCETGIRHDWTEVDTPPLLWWAEVGIGMNGITVAEGGVFTYGYHDKAKQDIARRLDTLSGKVLWEFAHESAMMSPNFRGTASTPTFHDGRVYAISRKGYFFCVDAHTGKLLWGYNVKEDFGAQSQGHGFSCSALIEGGMVIMDLGCTIALDRKTGDLVWKTKDYRPAYSSVRAFDFNNRRCLCVFNGIGLVILDAKDGVEIAVQEWDPKYINATIPTIVDDLIFLNSVYESGSGLVRIHPVDDPELIYRLPKRTDHHFANYVLQDGYLYGIEPDTVHCLEFSTGREVWAEEAGFGQASLMLADRKLIILGSGELAWVDATPEGYRECSRFELFSGTSYTPPVLSDKIFDDDKKTLSTGSGTCYTPPVLSDGRLYCRDGDGNLVCLDVRKKN